MVTFLAGASLLLAAGCDSVLGIQSHPLTTDAGSSTDASVDATIESVPVDSGAESATTSDSATDSAKPDAEDSGRPPSCAPGGPGMDNCGATSNESCCTSLAVGSGSFSRTFVWEDAGSAMAEADPASVTGLRLDKYKVTVGRFRQFVNAVLPADGGPGWLPPPESGKHAHLNQGLGLTNGAGVGTYEPGWVASDDGNLAPTNGNLACKLDYATWTSAAGAGENLPINCVNWWEAYAFCIWDGGFLPSESEREYTATAGSQQREYPWGSTDPGSGNQYAIYGCYYPNGSGSCAGVSNFAPVGTTELGIGAWGQLDLAGDVWEWNLDWYADTYANPCTDCAYLSAGSARVIRGGGYFNPSIYLLTYNRGYGSLPPQVRQATSGIRCARIP